MRFTPIEVVAGVAIFGSLMAIAVPTFVREVHASRFVEPIDGLKRLSVEATRYAEVNGTYPESAPLTPALPPRGHKEVDPPGTWDAPTWRALNFRPSAEGAPHAYAFAFDSSREPRTFVAQARGDLDGDGVLSTFEVRGRIVADHATVVPGMFVESKLE